MTSSDNLSTSILETKSQDKETLHTSTATKSEIETEPENREDVKISKHPGRSSAAYEQGSTNGLATLASDLTEQEANSCKSYLTSWSKRRSNSTPPMLLL